AVGNTCANAGTLGLNKSGANVAMPNNLTIGSNDGGTATARVVYASTAGTDQTANGVNVTLNRSGQLDFAGISDTINALTITDGSVINSGAAGTLTAGGGLTMNGGSVSTGGGTLALGNNVTVNPSGGPATIAGNLALGTAARTFTVNDAAARDDLIVSANLTSGTGGALVKAGTGVL